MSAPNVIFLFFKPCEARDGISLDQPFAKVVEKGAQGNINYNNILAKYPAMSL